MQKSVSEWNVKLNKRKIQRKWKLRGKFLLYMMLLIGILMGGVFIVVLINDRKVILTEGKKRGLSNTLYLAALSTPALLMYDYAKLEQNVDEVSKETDVVYALILDKNARVMAHSERDDLVGQILDDPVSRSAALSTVQKIQEYRSAETGGEIWDISYPIYEGGAKWGIARIGFSKERLRMEMARNSRGLLILSLIGFIISGAGATFLSERISKPVRLLSGLALSISKGNLNEEITISTGDEIEELAESFNRMTKELAKNIDRQRKLIQELSGKNVILKREIATRERLEEEIIKVERLRALGEMAGGIAHDFNNILGAVLGRAQLLLEKEDSKLFTKEIKIIEKAALDGAEIVRRIQEFTRVRMDSSLFTPLNLNEIVDDAVEFTRTYWKTGAQAQGVYITVEKVYGSVPSVVGDPAGLREVFTNLIINAVDAMPHGGTISLKTFCEGDCAVASISDTGTGMSPELQKRVFEPFFTTKGKRGNGLGLAMCYGIVSRHQGKILLYSVEGQGTTFTMQLPLNAENKVRIKLPASESGFLPARVLVVDDDLTMRSILRDILVHLGCKVDEAGSGKEGLDMFQPEKYDMIFSDLGMDDVNGWELAGHIKEQSPQIPIALITGWGTQLEDETMRSKGIDFLLSKPFRIDEIKQLLNKAMYSRENIQES